mgnify:CR=1 FL=1
MKYLEKAYDLYRDNSFLRQYTVHLLPTLAEAYLYRYITSKDRSGSDEKKYLHRTKDICKKAVSGTRRWPSHYGLALLVNAKYCAVLGKKKRADRLFQQSIRHHKKIGRGYCLARSHYEYGLFLSQADAGSNAKKNLETAYSLFVEIGANRYVDELRSLLGIKDDEGGQSSLERRIDNERLSSVIKLARDCLLYTSDAADE